MNEDQLYPAIYDQTQVNNTINKMEAKHILDKLGLIKKVHKHYIKLQHKWQSLEKVVSISGYSISISSGGVGVLLSFTTLGLSIPIAIAGTAIIESFVTAIIREGIIAKKILHYRKAIEHIQSYIDKFYIFSVKALKHKWIDDDEIKEFQQLAKEYDQGINIQKTEINKQDQHIKNLLENVLKENGLK